MIRDDLGKRSIFVSGRYTKKDELVNTWWITPEDVLPNQILNRLCTAGPAMCEECQGCAFGRFYLEHKELVTTFKRNTNKGKRKRLYEQIEN